MTNNPEDPQVSVFSHWVRSTLEGGKLHIDLSLNARCEKSVKDTEERQPLNSKRVRSSATDCGCPDFLLLNLPILR